MGHVPLEQQSTARLFFGFVGTVIVPVAAAVTVIGYCLLHFTSALVDFAGHVPFL
jgi:hypothetical protein